MAKLYERCPPLKYPQQPRRHCFTFFCARTLLSPPTFGPQLMQPSTLHPAPNFVQYA